MFLVFLHVLSGLVFVGIEAQGTRHVGQAERLRQEEEALARRATLSPKP